MPRPEIDILAYHPTEDLLWWVECKSYLDSPGVRLAGFLDPDHRDKNRYRVFTDPEFRNIASRVLKQQVLAEHLVKPQVKLRYCLVAGHFYRDDQRHVERLFNRKGWVLRGPDWVSQGLRQLADRGYENDIVTIAVKLLTRHPLQDLD
jgi:hypothetical protein